MEKDKVTTQWLNLLYMSPDFVIRAGASKSAASVQSVDIIPNNDGEYWVAGKTLLKCGREVASVFRVDTDTGGTLIGVYWYVDGNWWDTQDRPQVFEALGLEEAKVFPFDWVYAVPLEHDAFHG